MCSHAGCQNLAEGSGRYCAKHDRPEPKPFAGAGRSNSNLYNTTEWRKLRVAALKRFGYSCSRCGTESKTGLHVHHLKAPRGNHELFHSPDNLTVLCETCHRIITNGEIRKRKARPVGG